MPRNGSGVFSMPAGSVVTNGDTSDATDLNTPLADFEADANIPRPVVAGGTGASSAPAALVNLGLTATAAEINVLDGITATVTELNYTDGVTSAIQTQLDAKMATASYPTTVSLEGLSLAAGDLLYATAADTLARLAVGAAGIYPVSNGTTIVNSSTAAAPLPIDASGVGQWTLINAAIGAALNLPAGGTWAYFGFRRNAAGEVAAIEGDIAAGGTQIYAISGTLDGTAICWRIS